MTTKTDGNDEKWRVFEPRPPEDTEPRRTSLQRLKGKLLTKLKKDDPNVYPLY